MIELFPVFTPLVAYLQLSAILASQVLADFGALVFIVPTTIAYHFCINPSKPKFFQHS